MPTKAVTAGRIEIRAIPRGLQKNFLLKIPNQPEMLLSLFSSHLICRAFSRTADASQAVGLFKRKLKRSIMHWGRI